MKRRMIPIFLMLLAGAITSIITYIRDYELVKMLWTLLGVLIVFYALGVVIKKTLNLFDAQIEEAEKKAKEAEEKEKEKEGPVGEEETEEGDKQNTENPSED